MDCICRPDQTNNTTDPGKRIIFLAQDIYIWRFPKMGLPLVIILISRWDVPWNKSSSYWGHLHDYGHPQPWVSIETPKPHCYKTPSKLPRCPSKRQDPIATKPTSPGNSHHSPKNQYCMIITIYLGDLMQKKTHLATLWPNVMRPLKHMSHGTMWPSNQRPSGVEAHI